MLWNWLSSKLCYVRWTISYCFRNFYFQRCQLLESIELLHSIFYVLIFTQLYNCIIIIPLRISRLKSRYRLLNNKVFMFVSDNINIDIIETQLNRVNYWYIAPLHISPTAVANVLMFLWQAQQRKNYALYTLHNIMPARSRLYPFTSYSYVTSYAAASPWAANEIAAYKAAASEHSKLFHGRTGEDNCIWARYLCFSSLTAIALTWLLRGWRKVLRPSQTVNLTDCRTLNNETSSSSKWIGGSPSVSDGF